MLLGLRWVVLALLSLQLCITSATAACPAGVPSAEVHLATVVCHDPQLPKSAVQAGWARNLVKSVAMHASRGTRYVLHLFNDGNAEFEETVRNYWSSPGPSAALASAGVSLAYHAANTSDVFVKDFKICATTRLWLPDLLPQVPSLLYLDSDTLAFEDVGALAALFCNFTAHQYFGAAAARLHGGGYYTLGTCPFSDFVFPSGINSGVLLMELDRMRAVGFTRRIRHILTTRHAELHLGDQDARARPAARRAFVR